MSMQVCHGFYYPSLENSSAEPETNQPSWHSFQIQVTKSMLRTFWVGSVLIIGIMGEARTASQIREQLALILTFCHHQSCSLTTQSDKGVHL